MDNNFSLRLLPDLLGHYLCGLNIATEHHHLGSPSAHVEGSELPDASVASRDCHNLAIQPRFTAALCPLNSVSRQSHGMSHKTS